MRKFLGLLLMGAAMFSSCGNDHGDLYDPNTVALMKANEYAKAFVKEFGEIDPNHTWGFGNLLGSRFANTNSNDWDKALVVPENITEDELEAVLAVFNEKLSPSQNEHVNWSDFFVLHVYDGNNLYTTGPDQNGHEQTISPELDQLSTAYSDGGNVIDDVVNNFNHTYGSKMHMYNSGTLRFGYSNNQDGGNKYYDYVIRKINGAYYVGFDYSCNNPNNKVVGDGVYNDWIIKIVPAEYKNAKRIIAEDLGESDDFDFNDVVFDVATNNSGLVVTLRAAGGTLPLYINDKEVHELFGVSSNIMVNTGKNSKEIVIFTLPGMWNVSDVKLTVNDMNANVYYDLESEIGSAPQMICVDTNFEWPAERENIGTKYPQFGTYVNKQATAWY